MKKLPVIDLGRCTECGGCIECCPELFRFNGDTGLMEVIEVEEYPEDKLLEAVKNCPKKCIHIQEKL